jgi:hypothetical protein
LDETGFISLKLNKFKKEKKKLYLIVLREQHLVVGIVVK